MCEWEIYKWDGWMDGWMDGWDMGEMGMYKSKGATVVKQARRGGGKRGREWRERVEDIFFLSFFFLILRFQDNTFCLRGCDTRLFTARPPQFMRLEMEMGGSG